LFGLKTLMTRLVEPLRGTVDAPKLLVIVGGTAVV
jgi:hypothetical protein